MSWSRLEAGPIPDWAGRDWNSNSGWPVWEFQSWPAQSGIWPAQIGIPIQASLDWNPHIGTLGFQTQPARIGIPI